MTHLLYTFGYKEAKGRTKLKFTGTYTKIRVAAACYEIQHETEERFRLL